MGVETVIRLPDQFAIEAFFAGARFISCYEQDRRALRIEREGHSPFAICRAEAQLLHVCMPGSVQCINAGPPQLRPELLEKARQGQNLCLYLLVQRVELRLKLIPDLNNPAHLSNMVLNPYDVKPIHWRTACCNGRSKGDRRMRRRPQAGPHGEVCRTCCHNDTRP